MEFPAFLREMLANQLSPPSCLSRPTSIQRRHFLLASRFRPSTCPPKPRFSLPERAFGVKGLPADFLAYVLRQSHFGPFLGCLDWSRIVVEVGCRGHVLRGCSRRSFLVRRHPYPSLRESACLAAVVQAHRDLTPSILVRPSRGRLAVSINSALGNLLRVHWKNQTGLASTRASSSREEGPMQPRYFNSFPPVVSHQGFPRTPAVLK